MGIIIEDGKGSGRSVEVDVNNHLVVNAITQSSEHFANHTNGIAYNILFEVTPDESLSADGYCFLYVKNGSENDMIVEGFWLWLATNEYIEIRLGDSGTPVGGSSITPANLNSASGLPAIGTFQSGTKITGLTGGVAVNRFYHASNSSSQFTNFDQDLILEKNGVLTMYAEVGGTALHGTLSIHYHIM
jgi:hypothetical protein